MQTEEQEPPRSKMHTETETETSTDRDLRRHNEKGADEERKEDKRMSKNTH